METLGCLLLGLTIAIVICKIFPMLPTSTRLDRILKRKPPIPWEYESEAEDAVSSLANLAGIPLESDQEEEEYV